MSAQDNRLRFVIADDHAIFAETLREYLEKKYAIVGVVSDGCTLITEAVRLKPDIVIVDVGMPCLNGLHAAREIKRQVPRTKFVFLTMHDDANLAAATLELGVVAFVLKHSAGPELLKAIDEVVQNRPYITPRLRPEDWVVRKRRARQFPRDLTPQQKEFLRLFAKGNSMKEIAVLLDLSVKTVEFHKHYLMQAFNLKNNPDLVLFALKQGLISPFVPD